MIIKNILFFLLSYALATTVTAQVAVGLQAGFDNNNLNTNINTLSYTSKTTEPGFIFSTPVHYTINNWLSLKTAFTFLHKNYSYKRTGPYRGVYTTFTNSYLQFPVMASITYQHYKIQGFLNTGIYGAYWLKGKMKGRIPDIFNVTDSIDNNSQVTETFKLTGFNQKYNFNSGRDRRMEAGWICGMGFTFFVNKRNCLIIEADYVQSLTDQQKTYMVNQYKRFNQTFIFTIGYMHQCSKLTGNVK